MAQQTLSRRAAIAAGAATLAGCSGLPENGGDSRGSVESYRLPDVDETASPVIVESVPLTIGTNYLTQGADRVDELLSQLPIPLDQSDIPNGHIREKITAAAADAVTAVEGARTATSRLEALQSIRQGRSSAGFAASGWAVADNGRTVEEVRSEWQSIVEDGQSIKNDHQYLADDPVRAALVHAQIEQRLDRVVNREASPRSQGPPKSLLSVAAWGERAEEGRTNIADSKYLDREFREELPTDADNGEPRFRSAAESAFSDIRDRQGSLPPEPTERNGELKWRIQGDLRREAERQPATIKETAGPATAVIAATEGISAFLAYDRIQERLESGDRFEAEAPEDVITARETAIEALQAALDESPRAELARPIVADAARAVAGADREIARYTGEVRYQQIDGPVLRYAIATIRARTVPTACRQMVEALEP